MPRGPVGTREKKDNLMRVTNSEKEFLEFTRELGKSEVIDITTALLQKLDEINRMIKDSQEGLVKEMLENRQQVFKKVINLYTSLK